MSRFITRSALVAIIYIANFIINTPAVAQNASQTSESGVVAQQEQRERIATERARVNQLHEETRKACYQKFDVVSCQNKARDEKNTQLADLKRQETALNDQQRKQKAAERLSKVQERTSPEKQLQDNQARADRLRRVEEQDQRRATKALERERKAAQPPRVPRQAKAPPTPNKSKLNLPGQVKVPPPQEPGRAEKVAKALADTAAREKELAERQASASRRAAERAVKEKTKPKAASLPIPPEAK
jgi:colicin import membrane protein